MSDGRRCRRRGTHKKAVDQHPSTSSQDDNKMLLDKEQIGSSGNG